MVRKGALACVLAAIVLGGGPWVGLATRAEEKKAPPAAKGGKVVGILLDRKDTYLMVKPEGKQEPEKFLLAPPGGAVSPNVEAAAKKLFIPNLVMLKWQRQGEDPVVTDISALLPPPRRSERVSGGKRMINYSLTGTLVGAVVACATEKEKEKE